MKNTKTLKSEQSEMEMYELREVLHGQIKLLVQCNNKCLENFSYSVAGENAKIILDIVKYLNGME